MIVLRVALFTRGMYEVHIKPIIVDRDLIQVIGTSVLESYILEEFEII